MSVNPFTKLTDLSLLIVIPFSDKKCGQSPVVNQRKPVVCAVYGKA